jgi:N-methylhydantoinase B
MFTQWALRPDSGGAGLHRGGVGAVYEIEALSPGTTEVALLGERGRYAPFGVSGGHPAALNTFAWQSTEGWNTPPMASKIVGVKIEAGQRVRLEAPGGGGWGDPMQRPREAVARDIKLGFVSAERAAQDYGYRA